jgi:hypothetical protein
MISITGSLTGAWDSGEAMFYFSVNLKLAPTGCTCTSSQTASLITNHSTAFLKIDCSDLGHSHYPNFSSCRAMGPASTLLKILGTILILAMLVVRGNQYLKIALR